MKFPGFDHFFVLSPAFQASAIHVRPIDFSENPFSIARAEHRIDAPLGFEISSGTSEVDLVASEDPPLCLFSSEMKLLLQRHDLTGWGTFPIKLVSRTLNLTRHYEGFTVSGRCGKVQNHRSTKVTCLPPPGGRSYQAYKGLFFEEMSWDGTDIFMPEDVSYIIVSARTQAIFVEKRLSNLDFIRLPDFERLPSEL